MSANQRDKNRQGIDLVICGLEHSGTTLASDLFRQSPHCDSGFECGVLLCRTPKEFPDKQPFYNNMLAGWGIKADKLKQACTNECIGEFYDHIYSHSTLFSESPPSFRFDKTPRYIINLQRVRHHTSAPIIAMIKDPRAIAWSDFRRSKLPIEEIENWYSGWMPRKRPYMERAYKGYLYAWETPACLVTRLEDLCLNNRQTLERMFAHAGMELDLRYLNLINKRYAHTRGNGIDMSMATAHLTELPKNIQEMIKSDFGKLDRWFYAY